MNPPVLPSGLELKLTTALSRVSTGSLELDTLLGKGLPFGWIQRYWGGPESGSKVDLTSSEG